MDDLVTRGADAPASTLEAAIRLKALRDRAREERGRAASGAGVRYRIAASYSLADFVRTVSAGMPVILASILTALFLGGAYAVLRQDVYEAYSELYIDPRGLDVVDRDVTRATETTDGNVAWVESQMRIMTSSQLLKDVIASKDLADDPEFADPRPGLLAPIESLFGIGASQEEAPSVLGRLSEAVSTYRPQRSYIVEVHVRSQSAGKAAELSDAVATAYLSSVEESEQDLTRRASSNLSVRADSLRAAVSEAENRYEEFRAQNNIAGANGGLVSEDTLSQANRQLSEAELALNEATARRDQIRSVARSGEAGAIPEAVASPAVSALRQTYQTALEARARLAEDLLPRHPRMRAADTQVELAAAALSAELARIAAAAEGDYERALASRKDAAARVATLEQRSYATNEALVELRGLQRDMEAKRNVYTAYLQRATELAEQEHLDVSASRIISFAQVPRDPLGPSGLIVMIIAGVAGTVLGLLAVLLGAALRRSAAPHAGSPHGLRA